MSNKITEHSLGVDIKFIKKNLKRLKWFIKILRLNIIDDDNVNEKESTLYLVNHGQGFWGIVDVILILYYWYEIKGFSSPLYLISEPIVFKIPVMGRIAIKCGLKDATGKNLDFFLKNNASVILPPGGDGELLKPVWMKDDPVFTKSIYINGKMKLKTQEWYMDIALKNKCKIVPLGVSGTHEMTPIIYTSFLIHKYSGMAYLRRNELLPGYPITLNHFINIGIFLEIPISHSIWQWTIFIISHIYIDFLYTYPIIFRKIYAYFDKPIYPKEDYISLSVYDRKKVRRRYIYQVRSSIKKAIYICNEKRVDIFSIFYKKFFSKSFSKKTWNYCYSYLFILYMKRYSNYGGKFDEYFIK